MPNQTSSSKQLPEIDPADARITTPAPLDLFRSYRKLEPTPLNWLKAARAAMVWRARPGLRALPIYGRLTGWLWRFPSDVIRFMFRNSVRWKAHFGRPIGQQAMDLLQAAAVNGLMPRDYYLCDIAAMKRQQPFFDYIPYNLYATPVEVISALSGRESLQDTIDKWKFNQLFETTDIAVPECLALIRNGCIVAPDGAAVTLPTRDFLVKPAAEFQGRAISIWRYDGENALWRHGQTALNEVELQAELMRMADTMQGGAILQEVLENHPDIRPFAPYALSTFRTVTMMDETGRPVVVKCQFRTAVDPEAAVDNFHAGGCLFLVDFERGRFCHGNQGDYSKLPVSLDSHPANGIRLEGEIVPHLDQVLEIARRAHAHMPGLLCVGWDVAQTTKGLVILEANVPPGLQPTQQIDSGGFARTPFMALLAKHCQLWIEENESPHSRFRVGADLKGRASKTLESKI